MESLMKQSAEERILKTYEHLYSLYRLGAFEKRLAGRKTNWELEGSYEHYEYQTDPWEDPEKGIPFQDAIEDLFQLLLRFEAGVPGWNNNRELDGLRIRSLVYEVKDYAISVPSALEEFALNQARLFNEALKANRIEEEALKGQPSFVDEHPKDPVAKAIKVRALAALCGVNHLYRQHSDESFAEGLDIVTAIEGYVRSILPGLHDNPRPSFGLLGITLYLKGRLLAANSDFAGAREAFAQSGDAYVARLKQKEEFYRREYIKEAAYREKTAVTLRRAALVSALGLGDLFFLNSQVSKALDVLRLARATLMSNVPATYAALTDILYFACKRAQASSSRHSMEDVIKGLEDAREALRRALPESHHVHHASIELATALYYSTRLPGPYAAEGGAIPDSRARAIRLLDEAISYFEKPPDGVHHSGNRLHAEALIVKSYVIRGGLSNLHSNLTASAELADKALRMTTRHSRMHCEALIASGAAQTALANYFKTTSEQERSSRDRDVKHDRDEFVNAWRLASDWFLQALKLNAAGSGKGSQPDSSIRSDVSRTNARIEAVCYLRLTKLNLLDPTKLPLAHHYFNRWESIKERVEHQYCHDLAKLLSEQLYRDRSILVINSNLSLNYEHWERQLFDYLLNALLAQLSIEIRENPSSENKARNLLAQALQKQLGFKKQKAYDLIKDHDLVDRLSSMMH
jgi:hypothetical protein